MLDIKKNRAAQNIENKNSVQIPFEIPTLDVSYTSEENSVSLLEQLNEMEQKLLIEKRQIISTLVKWQSVFDSITEKKNYLLKHIENKHLDKPQNSEKEFSHKLFSVVTYSSSWDGLVFTVIAENDVWAKDLVHQWLEANGRKNHKIDKITALVSRDVRGIVNVGATLLDV